MQLVNQPDNSQLEKICVRSKMICATHYIAKIHFSGDVLGEHFDQHQQKEKIHISLSEMKPMIHNKDNIFLLNESLLILYH